MDNAFSPKTNCLLYIREKCGTNVITFN